MAKGTSFQQVRYLDHHHLIEAQLLYFQQNTAPVSGELCYAQEEEVSLFKRFPLLFEKAQSLKVRLCALEAPAWLRLRRRAQNLEAHLIYKGPCLPVYEVTHFQELEERLPHREGLCGVILDQLQDPQNFGALLRSAAFYGLDFCLISREKQCPVTAAVAKASAGGIFGIQVFVVGNLRRALTFLKSRQYWVLGTQIGGGKTLPVLSGKEALVCVLGNEGRGLRQSIAQECDWNIEIPSRSRYLDSLNVSVAGSILFDRICSSSQFYGDENAF